MAATGFPDMPDMLVNLDQLVGENTKRDQNQLRRRYVNEAFYGPKRTKAVTCLLFAERLRAAFARLGIRSRLRGSPGPQIEASWCIALRTVFGTPFVLPIVLFPSPLTCPALANKKKMTSP